MPRDPFKPLTIDEQRFVYHYVREGSVPEVAYLAERKCRLKKGTGMAMLKRQHVLREIERRRVAVEMAENELIAKDKAVLAREADERQKITNDKIEKAIEGVLTLDPKTHASVILEAAKLGFVYTGTIRDGHRERVTPSDPTKEATGAPSFYASIFSGLNNGETNREIVDFASAPPAPLVPGAEAPKAPDLSVPAPQPSTPRPPAPPAKGAAAAAVTSVTIT